MEIKMTSISLDSTSVKDGLVSSITAAGLLQIYTNTVITTPDICLPEEVDELSKSNVSEALPEHQDLARENAQFYMDSVNPTLLTQSSSIIGFANLWNAEYKHLLRLAKNIDNDGNKIEFTDGIKNLIISVKGKKKNAHIALTALNDFLPLVQIDSRNFTSDANSVSMALDGEDGIIKELEKTIESCNTAIDTDIAIITGGAMGTVGGIATISYGAYKLYKGTNKKKAIKTIVKGVLATGASGTAMGFAIADLEVQQELLKKTMTDLSYDQAISTAMTNANGSITSLVNAVNGGIQGIESLINSWTTLEGDLQAVIDQLDVASPELGDWLVDTLEAANQTWNDTLALAKSLQQNGLLNVTEEQYDIAA